MLSLCIHAGPPVVTRTRARDAFVNSNKADEPKKTRLFKFQCPAVTLPGHHSFSFVILSPQKATGSYCRTWNIALDHGFIGMVVPLTRCHNIQREASRSQ